MSGGAFSLATVSRFRAVTPGAGADNVPVLADAAHRGLTCTGAGNAVVIGANDAAPVTIALAPGAVFPGRFRGVLSAGTTATGIVACYD